MPETLWGRVRAIGGDAVRDLVGSWKSLAAADLAYRAVFVALLMPGTTWLLYWLRSGTSARVVSDAEILRFFVTTRIGVLIVVLGAALLIALTALEVSVLMTIGLAAADGKRLRARDALVFAAAHAPNVLRLALQLVLRVLAALLPFLAAAGLIYWGLLREHDINYYLARRPSEFWLAVAAVAAIVAALATVLVRWIPRWALALPLVMFEGVSPRRALGESRRRSTTHRLLIVVVLAAWAAFGLASSYAATWIPAAIGRGAAPYLVHTLGLLLVFIAGLALVWIALGLAVAIFNISLLALLLGRLYLHAGPAGAPRLPASTTATGEAITSPRLSGRATAGLAAVAVVGALGFALAAFLVTRSHHPVQVIAHRGASAAAPENTLAAFRLAVEQGADFVELDVQESADGEVVVAHDTDLMKLGGAAMKIWESPLELLRSVDLGSRVDPRFSSERMPTLAEALAVCKGRSRVIVELKSYGHNDRLEERVIAVVEAAGMADDCMFMSLDHDMVRKMKQLRPNWRSGVLVAKALGDLTSLGADFLAVEARMATGRFVRRAHRAGQDVYVWTVNDPAWMLAAMSHGVDGLITDKPDLAREVVAQHAQMSDAQRLLVALLIRWGARTESLEDTEALRP